MAVEVDAENYVRPKLQQKAFQVAFEVLPSVGAVASESFLSVVDEVLSRISFDVTGGRLRRLIGKLMPVAVAEEDNPFARHAQNLECVDCLFSTNLR